MSWDYLASERHFVDHLAPIYRAAPGTFHVPADLDGHARGLGIEPTLPEEGERPILVASYGDVKKARRMGRTRIAFIEHGIGQSYGSGHSSYAGGKDRDDVSLFLVPNDYAANLWRQAYPDATVEVVGSPRLDDLPQREPGPPTVCISFHWSCHLVPETAGAFAYYRDVFKMLAAMFNVIGHAHPRAQLILERRYRRVGIPMVPDFADVCRQADLYICDNSSTLYEFAATGRPVIVLNQPSYRRNVEHGLRFWEAADVGIQVNHPSELMDAIGYALTDPARQRTLREAALKLVYRYRSGAARRAVIALERWASRAA